MKLRVRKNSIRLRLTQGEVAEFADKGIVEETVEFGAGSRFCYGLRSAADAAYISANFDDGIITITAPLAVGESWAATDQVGIESEQRSANGGGVLKILIEKDLSCLEPRSLR